MKLSLICGAPLGARAFRSTLRRTPTGSWRAFGGSASVAAKQRENEEDARSSLPPFVEWMDDGACAKAG